MGPLEVLAEVLPGRPGCVLTGPNFAHEVAAGMPAAAVVVEAMVAIVLADAYLEKFGGDNLAETRSNMERFRDAISWSGQGPLP